ncbi:MAG: glycoside hydrolase [Marinilabiliales bacterium]|nr:MAG: glycoside hydrolase [Marinilabiliales bacterium]
MFYKFPLLLLFMVLFTACNKDEPAEPNDDPYDLSIELLSLDTETREAKILANAQNTVKYALHIGSASEPVSENTTGLFTYTFSDVGLYQLVVKAYGSSGRFIKASQEIDLSSPQGIDTIPLDRGYTTPLEYDGYALSWNDEFNGNSVNSSNWTFEIGTGSSGWGNNELQYYTEQNATVENETLIIEARKENVGSSQYTSSRLVTKNKVSFTYGRVDIRALLPHGKGMWPALWMLGENISSVGWPACGEIDIMEMVGNDDNSLEKITHGTIHYDDGGHVYTGGSHTLTTSTLATSYHVFSLIWDETSIKWYVDDMLYHQESITAAARSEFHNEFFFIFNVAVGGNWPGSPNSQTTFPQRMKVDYIRVFQKQ